MYSRSVNMNKNYPSSRLHFSLMSKAHPDTRSPFVASGMPPKRPPPVGGHQQKRQWSSGASSSSTGSSSALAKFLIDQWSWGAMSAPTIQKIAFAARQDGLSHAEITIIASLGSEGRNPQNCHVELLKKLSPMPIASTLSSMTVHMRKSANLITRLQHEVLLPHELFSCMYHSHPNSSN